MCFLGEGGGGRDGYDMNYSCFLGFLRFWLCMRLAEDFKGGWLLVAQGREIIGPIISETGSRGYKLISA